jgi:aryl-alcohol dehydrogenase-like predicted oxidoreductase
MTEVNSSLRRLQTDYIDLYQVHRPDPGTDIEETLAALSDLIHAGKVRAIGSSSMPASDMVEAQWVAERRGLERFRAEQPPYSILSRRIEAEVLPVAQRYGMGARWSNCMTCLQGPRSPSATTSWTGSTRSSHPAPTSARRTSLPTCLRHSTTPACAAAPSANALPPDDAASQQPS